MVTEKEHERLYRQALNVSGATGCPTWAKLPEETREIIRKENIEYLAYLDKIADSIVNGTPLPPLS